MTREGPTPMPIHGLASTVALVAWGPLCLLAFSVLRFQWAALITLLGGLMFLPELAEFDFPLVPPIGKQAVAALTVLAAILWKRPGLLLRARPDGLSTALIVALLAGGIGTALTNGDPLTYGGWMKTNLPPLAARDALSFGVRDLLGVALPFFLGRALFSTPRDLRDLLRFLAVAGLVYSAFLVVEMRLSPQFHRWVYGYHQHEDFSQTLRWGGYRPMVFMAHGLAVSLFMLISSLAAVALWRARGTVLGLPARILAPALGVVTVLCKSTGAIVYGVTAGPLLLWTRVRAQMRIVALLSVVVIAYPTLRALDLFPTAVLVEAASSLSEERALSLAFRFDTEDRVSNKAAERPWFGWGGFGRNLTYDDQMGKLSSVVDGYWIIQMSERGLFGFVPCFGLLLWPVWLVRRRIHRLLNSRDKVLLSALTVILTVATIDLLPNGLFNNLPFLLAGALSRLAVEIERADLLTTTADASPPTPEAPHVSAPP